jgi:dephospho-CoA kinase
VWVVIVKPETAIARVTASRDMTADEVRRRIDAQLSNAARVKLADRVIENDGTLDDLRERVREAWHAVTG